MASRSGPAAAALSVGLAASLLTGVHSAAPAAAAVTCAAAGGTKAAFYPGPSASDVYDGLFAKGPAMPGLPTYVPQGLTTWNDWDGKGKPMLLLGAYRTGHTSRLYGIDPATGAKLGGVKAAASHLGGIAVAGRWLFVQHQSTSGSEYVRKYKLSDLRAKLKERGTPTLESSGSNQKVYGADFMSAYGNSVWMGRYSNRGPDKMHEYKVDKVGKLSRVGNSWPIPKATQGAVVTADRLVFATGVDTASLWVYERSRNLGTAAGRCFRAPSHGENLALVGRTVYHAYEGGSARYIATAPNKVVHLHKAPFAALRELVNP